MSSKKYPRNKDFSEIGKRIREIRKGLSQGAFGKLFGVNQNTVSRWEKGQVLSDEETLRKIAAYGGKTYDWLLRGDEAQPPQLREFAPEQYDTRLAVLKVDNLIRSIILARKFQKSQRQKLSDSGEAQLISYIYEYIETEYADPGEVVIRRLADLIKRQKQEN